MRALWTVWRPAAPGSVETPAEEPAPAGLAPNLRLEVPPTKAGVTRGLWGGFARGPYFGIPCGGMQGQVPVPAGQGLFSTPAQAGGLGDS